MQLASNTGDSPRAELKKEIGVFVGITTVLTALTVAGAYYWQRRDERLRLSRSRTVV